MEKIEHLSTKELVNQFRIATSEDWRSLWHHLKQRKDAEPFMVQLLKDENVELRLRLIDMVPKDVSEVVIGALLDALSDKNDGVRQAAATRLGTIKSAIAVEPLIALTTDSSALVQEEAIRALGNIGDKQATKALCKSLQSTDQDIRLSTVIALYKIQSPASVDALIGVLEDSLPAIRLRAVDTLGRLGDKRALQPLVAMLSDQDIGVSSRAADALVQLGGVDAIPYLVKALADEEDEELREYFECCIEEITSFSQEGANKEIPREQWLYRTWLSDPTINAGTELYKFYENETGEVKDFHMGVTRDYASFNYRIVDNKISISFGNKNEWVETKFEIEPSTYDHPDEGDVSCLKLVFENEPYFTDFIEGTSTYYYIDGIGTNL
jgi:hypothetical protein